MDNWEKSVGKYLALDYGEKRLGLAISDVTRTIARPYRTLSAQSLKQIINELRKIIEQENIEKIIVGLPRTLKGTDSRQTEVVREFVQELQQRLTIPIVMEDERLTTIQAHATLHALGKKPSRHRDRVDQYAAVHLLQTVLDREKWQQKRDQEDE